MKKYLFYLACTLLFIVVAVQAQKKVTVVDNVTSASQKVHPRQWMVRDLMDTPKVGYGIRLLPGNSRPTLLINRLNEFIISDSLGEVARRDSAGAWHIKDCNRTINALIKIIYK